MSAYPLELEDSDGNTLPPLTTYRVKELHELYSLNCELMIIELLWLNHIIRISVDNCIVHVTSCAC